MRPAFARLATLSMVVTLTLAAWAANPVPQLLAPTLPGAARPGTPGFTLTVYGFGFAPGATIYWDGKSRSTTYYSSSKLAARIQAGDLSTPHTANITVVNPAPGGGTSNVTRGMRA